MLSEMREGVVLYSQFVKAKNKYSRKHREAKGKAPLAKLSRSSQCNFLSASAPLLPHK
jgi:hypothetical protein